jgi:dTDP-4-dehydrorhamnose reductase
MPVKPRLLITGASGLLGEALCRSAMGKWSVTGIHHRHPLGISGVSAARADLADDAKVKDLFTAIDPQAVIHAAAIAQPAACEKEPYSSAAVNVHLPELLAGLCAARKIPFVFTSTDLVFDGRLAPYDETHAANPVCTYGRQKAQAERAVADRYADALVCRLPLMFGVTAHSADNFTSQMLMAMCQGRPVNLFTDEFRTPVDTQSAARGLLVVLGRARGVLHMGGRTRVSRFALGIMMAEYLGVAPGLLQPVTIDSFALNVARSPDCTLDSRKAYRLGYDPMPLRDAVKRVVEQFRAIQFQINWQ